MVKPAAWRRATVHLHWRHEYNERRRPHSSLGRTPPTVFAKRAEAFVQVSLGQFSGCSSLLVRARWLGISLPVQIYVSALTNRTGSESVLRTPEESSTR
jgi:hypothetical protein